MTKDSTTVTQNRIRSRRRSLPKIDLPGYSTLEEFATSVGISYSQALKDYRKGFSVWPGRRSGLSPHGHPLRHTWLSMLRRAYHKTSDVEFYKNKGIDIDPRWVLSFWDFVSDMGPKPGPTYSIDRIDNDKGYWPANCRWATKRQQAQNTSRFKGYIVKDKNSYRVGVMTDRITTNRYFKTKSEAEQWVLESGLLDRRL